MKRALWIISSDLRLIFRDRMLILFLFLPFVMMAAIRYLIPYLTAQFPSVAEYHGNIMMFAGMEMGIMFGVINSFMILEEKDVHVLQALRVLPISSGRFLFYRLFFGTCYSFVCALLVIHVSGFAYPGLGASLLLALLYSAVTPFIALLVGGVAANKIEGMAYFKGVNLLLILPMIGMVLGGWIKFLFAPFPIFWAYFLYETALQQGAVLPVFLVGLSVTGVVLWGLGANFRKQVLSA